jgi:hypothetical protein
MRAGPLSRTDVSETLNKYFVSVYTSNEDYREDKRTGAPPAVPPEEVQAYQKIYRAALDAKLSTGTVHAYVLSPDGQPVDSLHVADAARDEKLLQMLRRAVDRFQTPPGETLVKPKVQSSPPPAPSEGGMVLHLTARAEGTNPSDNAWHAYPSEDWIVLTGEERAKLLPRKESGVRVGTTWEVEPAVATKVLTHFYPQTENNDVGKNRIDLVSLRATMVSDEGGVARARLDGDLRMCHPFYHKHTEDVVEAKVVGYLEFEPATQAVTTFKLATDKATYMKRGFDAGVRNLP